MEKGFWANLPKPIIGLSPMDGVSDAAFRFITAKYGKPSLLITEFTNVEALNHGAVKALTAFLYDEVERPIVAQIYGTSPEAFYRACFAVCELGFDGIDINMGCPSKSVSGNGGGAGLIRNPQLAQEIIRECWRASRDWATGKTMQASGLHPDIIAYIENLQKQTGRKPERRLLPVSVKTRIGYDQIVTEEWLKYILECQPVNISLHGRTLKQMYTGEANWEEIAKAARLVHSSGLETTLIGNGDIKSLPEAMEKIVKFGVDGVLIGRGSFGEPWIFQGESKNIEEKLQVAIEHCHKYEEIFGINDKSFAPMKKHLGWYCTNFPGAKELRLKLMTCNSAIEVNTIISSTDF
jgi:nifR3 family TIM-barrel protein